MTSDQPGPEEQAWRHTQLRAAMAEADLDGLLAFAPPWRRENVRYLTASPLRSTAALAYLPATGEPTAFVQNDADVAAVRRAGFVKDIHLMSLPTLDEVIDRLSTDCPKGCIGVGHAELVPEAIWEPLQRGLPKAKLESATALMDKVRLVKSDWEIAQIRRCAQLADAGWETLLAALRPGVAEYEVIAQVEATLKNGGSEDNFMLIATGGDEVRGMTAPADRRMQPGDMLRTELTPQRSGYWAQICRSAVLGEPTAGQRDSAALFEEAVAAGIDAIHPGVTAHDVAKAENDVFRRYGYGEYCTAEYTRVRGHGHGLHLDEFPLLEGAETVLEENTVLIVHPNTYTPLAGYHVLGDPVIVTQDGTQPLLRTPRELANVAT